jgi:hypothetical protein
MNVTRLSTLQQVTFQFIKAAIMKIVFWDVARRVVWYKLANVSGMPAASVIRA